MKKSRIIANVVIVCMFVALIGITISNAHAQSVKADNRVIYSGDTTNTNVCFMINVYQGNEYIADILDILDLYKIRNKYSKYLLMS